MTELAEKHLKVKELFHEALRLDPKERDSFLARSCIDDIELRIEVESLLISLAEAKDFLERPVIGVPSTTEWKFSDGQTISHYRINSPIGVGGMGEVYLAEDLSLRRQVALKIVPDDLAADRAMLRRFKREALLVSGLNHPNIVTVFEFGSDGAVNLLATEYVKGKTLRERMDSGPISTEEAIDVAIQIGSALQAAHEAGVIHRDIKPENVMIRDDGYVKVLDFGLAKLSEQIVPGTDHSSGRHFSQPGVILGTAAYMSPEQTRSRSLDARSDIFSLGVVVYEMVTGINPFKGERVTDVLAAIIQKIPPPPRRFAPEIPDELNHIIVKALEKDRGNRYQTAEDMLAELRRLKKRIELREDRDGYAESKAAQARKSQTKRFYAAVGVIVLLMLSLFLIYRYFVS